MLNAVTRTDATILQPFGVNPGRYATWGLAGHDGVDLRTYTGQTLFAPVEGEIRGPFWDPHGWGLNLAVERPNGERWYLCHLQDVGASQDGDAVVAGTPICHAGMTGNTDTEHVHVTLHPDAHYDDGPYHGRVDPVPYLHLIGLPPI